jgi:hypothetical protein
MSSPTAAYRSPFRLSPVSPLQLGFLSLPLELRYKVYAEIFQPRTYLYERGIGFIIVHHKEYRFVIPKTHRRPQACFLSDYTCSCCFGGAVSLLRTCQQIYIEAQPHFLLSATLELHAIPHINGSSCIENKVDHLWSFYQKCLRSSLSGLIPGDYLRRLDLRFTGCTDHAVYDGLSVVNDCRLRLDYLQLQFVDESPPSYCRTNFTSDYLFMAMSLLRDIKNVQLLWGFMDPSMVRASDGPEIYKQHFSRRCDLHSAQRRYCGLLNRAFSELTSRPRTTKGRKRSTTLHKEAKAIFHTRMQELMEESGLYLASDT